MGSSTLCTVAVGMNNKVFFYNIGDSGLYVLHYGVPPVKNGSPSPSAGKEWIHPRLHAEAVPLLQLPIPAGQRR